MTWETLAGSRPGKIRVEGSAFRYEREDGAVLEGWFELDALEPGVFNIRIGGRSYRVAHGAPGELMVNGMPVSMEVFDPRSLRGRKSRGVQAGRQDISAAMPGKVIRLLVAAGDTVEAGQGLVVVEAMKMQNEMKSPKAGRVAEVRTRLDAAVVAGEVLMVVE